MSKRKRELTQRLEELFSAPAGPEESTEAVSTPGAGLAQLVQTLATQNDPTFLATLLDHIPLPIYIKDREHKWIAVNPGFAQLLKRTADQLIGRADKEQSDDDWQHDDRVLESGRPEETEATTAQPTGAPAIRQVVTRLPLLNAAGVAEFMIGIIRPADSSSAQPEPSQLGSVLQSLVEGYYEIDLAGNFVKFNQAICEFFGYSADELHGLNDRQYTDPETAKLLYATYNQVYRTGEPARGFGWPIIRKDGAIRYVEASISLVRDRDGKPIGFQGIVRDITERQQAESQVLQRNQQLAALNQISQTLVAQTDIRAAIQQVGDIIRRLFNVSEAYIALYDQKTNMLELPFFIEGNQPATVAPIPLGQGLASIVIQSRQPVLINHDTVQRAQELGAIITGKQAQSYLGVPILAGDDAIGVISIQSVETPGLFNANDAQLLSTVAANLGAAIRNAQLFQETQQAEQRLRVIVDTSPIPILISRLSDGMVLFANERLGPLFGLRTEDLIRRITPDFYFDPSDRQILIATVQREGQVSNYELHVKKSDGQPFWVVVSLQPMIFNGERSLFSGFYDITERKLVESQVLQRNMQLAALNRISQELAQLAEPSEICELIYREIGQVLDNRNLYVALYDEATQQISFPVYTIDGERRPVAARPFANGMTEYVLRQKLPLLIPHAVDAETQKLGIANIGRSAESWMGAPLLVGDKAIGVLTLQDYHQADAYTADHLELLTTIAAQAAIALENARLFTQTQQELSERKLAEKELLKLKLGFERSNDAIFITDIDGKITYVNPGFTTVYGYTGAEAIGHTPRILKSGLLTPESYQNFWSTLLSKGAVAGEIINKAKDGRLLTIEGNNNPIVDETGSIIGFLAVHRDITERKQTEEAVRRRADQLAALNRIGRELVQLKPIDEILETVYQSVGEVIDNRNFYIALHNEGETGIYYPIYTFDSVRSEPHSRAYGKALTEHVLETKQPLLIPRDVVSYLSQIGIDSVGRPAQCWMGVPLLVGSRAIGVIALQDYEHANIYTQSDVELLTLVASQAAIAMQNTRLFTQTQARVDELAVLNEIGRAASGLLNVHELLELTYRQVARVMRADGFFVGLYDPNRETISYPLCYDGGEIFSEPDSVLDPETHSYQVITTGQPLFVEYSEEQRNTILNRSETMIGDKEGLPASVMFAPLKAGDQVLGVISVQSYTIGKHTPENLNLLVNIANQIAVSLENARLFDEAQRLLKETEQRNTELAIINNMQAELAALATELNMQSIYDAVGNKIREIFHQTDMAIRMYDPQTNLVHYPYAYENGQRIEIDAHLLPEKGFGPHVLRTRETLVINENMAHVIEEYGSYTLPGTQMEKSLVMVPLIAGGQARGLIHLVDNEHEHAFSDSDVRLLTTLANSMSVALENARLFEQTRSRADELLVLNELAQRLSARLSTDQVLDETYQGVKRLMDAENFYVGLYDQPKHQISLMINVTHSEVDREITTISADDGISGYIVRNRTSVMVGNGINQWAQKMGLRTVGQDALSWLGVPMIVGDQVLGVMAVQNYVKVNAYDDHDRELLTVFANQTATAIQNALLFERTQQDALRERTINRISAKIRNTQSVEQILRIATEELRLATQAARSIAQIAPATDQPLEPNGHNTSH